MDDQQQKTKPLGRFQSTYTKEMGAEPKLEDYTFATRHGVRDEQASTKTNIEREFKFPTGVSAYKTDFCHSKVPDLDDYGHNKQPCNDHKVESAPFAGYKTTYSDQSLLLRHELEGKRGKESSKYNKVSNDDLADNSKPLFGPWNYTGHLKEDIFIQRDKSKRIEKGLYHLPGYLGHQPLHNPPSSTAYQKRKSEKEQMLLYDLDQYSREIWPHYKGHKPQALINVREPPVPTKDTTYGYTNHLMQRQQAWSKANHHTRVSPHEHHKQGATKTFFTDATTGSTSANGVVMAEKYYTFCRPLEGTLISFKADRALASKHLD